MNSHTPYTQDDGFSWGLPELGVVDVSREKADAIRSLAHVELQRSMAQLQERGDRLAFGEVLELALLSLFSVADAAWAVAAILTVLRM